MEKSAPKSPRLHGLKLNTLAASFDANQALAEALRGLKAKLLAIRARTSPRTAENWLQATNGPTWKHTVAMLNDDELCARLLAAAGREDLARSAETIAHLKAALRSEGK